MDNQSPYLQEIANLGGIVEVALFANSLYFSQLPSLGSSFDVLAVDDGVLAGVDQSTQIEEKPLVALERFEQFDYFGSAQLLGIFGTDLNDDLEVLTHIQTQQVLQDLQRIVYGQTSKVVDEELIHTRKRKERLSDQ